MEGGNTSHGGYSGFFPAVCLLNLIEPSLQIHLHIIHKLISRKPLLLPLPRLFRRSVQTFKFACEEGLMNFNEMVR